MTLCIRKRADSMANYNISENDFSRLLNDKIRSYNALVGQAEVTRRDHWNKPTKREAELYLQAAHVCAEIMAMNQSEQATYGKWSRLKRSCETRVEEISRILNPPEQRAAEPARPREQQKTSAASPQSSGAAKPQEEFVTQNATKEVPKEMIRSWYKEMPRCSFDEIVGVDAIRDTLEKKMFLKQYRRIRERLGLEAVESFLFYGPPGTGKTSVIEAFVHELMEEDDFKYIHLESQDILDSLVGVAEKKVNAVFQEAIDNAPCIIFIDELDNLCAERTKPNTPAHQKSLTVAFLEAYNRLVKSGKQVIYISAANHLQEIDQAVRDRFNVQEKIDLPNAQLRQLFFERKLQGFHLEDGLDLEQIAAKTEGFSFRELNELTQELMVEFGRQIVRENIQTKPDGSEDRDATDAASEQAIEAGTAVLSKALFEQKCEEAVAKQKERAKQEGAK